MSPSSASPWPWVEEDRSKSEPIPPVTEHDGRPAVKDLIGRHSEKIGEVQSKLRENELFDEKKHDELWILRFLLSHRLKIKPSVQAAIATLEYRQLHQLDASSILDDWPGHQCSNPKVRKYHTCCDDDAYRDCLPHPQRGLLTYVRLAGIHQSRLLTEIQDEEDLPFPFFSEWTFQWHDRITRQTGRLTQAVRVIDVSDFQFAMVNRENEKRVSKLAKKLSDFYPQTLAKILVCNPPGWLYVLYRAIRLLMPKRVAEKVEFCQPKSMKRDLDILLTFASEEHIPRRLGGSYETWPVEHIIVK